MNTVERVNGSSVPNRQGDRQDARERHDGRDARGRFGRGNRIGPRFDVSNGAAVSHGLTATTMPPEFAHLQDELRAFVDGALVDEGDPADVPTRRRSLLEYRARVHRRVVQLDAAIELRGLVDKRGKLRVAWLQRLEGLIATAVRLDTLLGLERRAKKVPSLAEALAGDSPDA